VQIKKRKETVKSLVSFVLLVSSHKKAARKMLVKLKLVVVLRFLQLTLSTESSSSRGSLSQVFRDFELYLHYLTSTAKGLQPRESRIKESS